jgi:hypothetical protein
MSMYTVLFQGEVARVQHDPSTYLTDPVPNDAYEEWLRSNEFNVETRKGDITQLLMQAPHVRSFFARFVPAQTTHAEFWSRYYFRLHLIDEEEERRARLLRRAHEICSETTETTTENKSNDWDEAGTNVILMRDT